MLVKLLAVEDSPDYAALIRSWLSGNNRNIQFEVTVIQSLGAALGRLASEEFDVILIDLSLADAEGIGVLQTLRLHKPTIPMVVLSATEDDKVVEYAIHLGAQDFITKADCSRRLLVLTIMQSIVRHLEGDEAAASRPLVSPLTKVKSTSA